MNPAASVIVFTTAAGAAQGLAVGLSVAVMTSAALSAATLHIGLGLAALLLLVGLGASFFHLGHPRRAWRAAAMWRTSWLSREVIVLPALLMVLGIWWVLPWWSVQAFVHPPAQLLPTMVVVLSVLLWICTAQIYACLRFIQEWAHVLTIVNFTLIGLSSGLVLLAALAASRGHDMWLQSTAPWALTLTFAAWAAKTAALLRNATIKPRSTAQSATGIHNRTVLQKSMGMSAGSFNTREFFHGMSRVFMRRIRWAVHLLGFALPIVLMCGLRGDGLWSASGWWWLVVGLQFPGVLAERWLFFAQARHPQNLYYQVVS